MKIGEFAKKHHVTIDTVRHYVSEGLLTPVKVNTQYDFCAIDEEVLDSILLLKSMNFKLEEMRPYLLFQTMFQQNTFSYLGSFEAEFREKIKENEKQIEALKEMNRRIEKHLAAKKEVKIQRGVPIRLIPEFFCPDCDVNLELEQPEMLHNEIISGRLVCPDCGRSYHIRYGCLSDVPVADVEEVIGVKEMLEQYLQQNDEEYIVKIRELFTETANCVEVTSAGAKNVLIDGQGCCFLDRSILRALSSDCFVLINCQNNIFVKIFEEDVLPANALVYDGKKENIPLKRKMDYLFLQNYDMEFCNGGGFKLYPYLADAVKMDCFKALILKGEAPLPDEEAFLADMKQKGMQKTGAFLTGSMINRKESPDMTVFGKKEDLEMKYGIYQFKTLG